MAKKQNETQNVIAELDTIKIMLTDLQDQVAGLREEITGIDSMNAPTYSLDDVGRMLTGLRLVLQPEYKAKAFELFDAYPVSARPECAEWDELLHSTRACLLGVSQEQSKEWYRQWRQQREKPGSPSQPRKCRN